MTALALAVCSLATAPAALAQSGKRLSAWLLEQPRTNDDYPLGLSWRVAREVPTQNALLIELLKDLSAAERGRDADPVAARRLHEWLSALPVTGRVSVASADPRWLEVRPDFDPVLGPGDSVDLPRRPTTVTVITDRGERCAVGHRPGFEAAAYVRACGAAGGDWAWIAQPDGRVQRFGAALWNEDKQDLPAPGAWIWSPSRGSGWPERFSDRLITFLATQGPAQDPADVKLGRVSEPKTGSELPAIPLSSLPRLGSQPPRPQTTMTLAGDTPPRPSRDLQLSASDWGGIGLLQTPTARMEPAGSFRFHLRRTDPYTQGNVFAQPFDWLEAGFRYTDIGNRAYGPQELSGDQSYKDKAFDLKLRLWPESAYVPQIAVGFRDLAGTGLFAGEYLVGNKRFGAFDFSLGVGWGYVGARGDVRNPLARLRSSFETRGVDFGQGGEIALTSFFRGPTAFFGGVQMQTPWEPLTLKLEYEGNNYSREPLANPQTQRTPWNAGLVYRAAKAVDLTFGIERGNTVMLGFVFRTDLDSLTSPKVLDAPRVPVADMRAQKPADWAQTSRDIGAQTDWLVTRVERSGRELRLEVENAGAMYWRDRLDRAVSVLHRDAPPDIDRFVVRYPQNGAPVVEHEVDRDAWVAERVRPLPPSMRREPVIAREVRQTDRGEALYAGERPRFQHGLGIGYQQTIGGPDAFILYQVSVVERLRFQLRHDTWIQSTIQLGLLNNYDKFRYTAPSELPRVRTFMREYLTESRLTMPNLQLTHVGRLTNNQYYSVYGGYLEMMFAGVGAEWLYRPMSSRVAFGLDANAVQQREFEQGFGLRDYKVATGHASVYWDTGWKDVLATVNVGRYLAGDVGATLQLSRVFKNGVTLGAFATRTNVSSEQFGEGSFDKGLFVSIPFDAILPRSSNALANIVWKPLTRDGGAMLTRSVRLYDMTNGRSDRSLWYAPAKLPNESLPPAEHQPGWTPTLDVPEVPPQPETRQVSSAWRGSPALQRRLEEALVTQDFRNVAIQYDQSHRLTVELEHAAPGSAGALVGRAARTALAHAPLDAREMRVRLKERGAPVVTYDFIDLTTLQRFFSGRASTRELAPYVAVEYHDVARREADPLARIDDMRPIAEPTLTEVIPGRNVARRVTEDVSSAARKTAGIDWLQGVALGLGVVSSASFDRKAYTFARDHAEDRWLKAGVRVGDALPWVALGGAAIAALDTSDPVRSRTGYASLEAGGSAFLLATGLKYAVGRQRPGDNVSNRDFKSFSRDDNRDAFPSRHTMVTWAAVTPFAIEYGMPWLYAGAALTNLARIGSREHWVSDTVGASLLGYGLGRLFYEVNRAPAKGMPRVHLSPTGVALAWETH